MSTWDPLLNVYVTGVCLLLVGSLLIYVSGSIQQRMEKARKKAAEKEDTADVRLHPNASPRQPHSEASGNNVSALPRGEVLSVSEGSDSKRRDKESPDAKRRLQTA